MGSTMLCFSEDNQGCWYCSGKAEAQNIFGKHEILLLAWIIFFDFLNQNKVAIRSHAPDDHSLFICCFHLHVLSLECSVYKLKISFCEVLKGQTSDGLSGGSLEFSALATSLWFGQWDFVTFLEAIFRNCLLNWAFKFFLTIHPRNFLLLHMYLYES